MNPYIAQLRKDIAAYQVKCGVEDSGSVLDSLWDYYSASNPVDDGYIKRCVSALAPVFQELSVNNSDVLFDLIADLCTAYQRAAFLEGIQAGVQLSDELHAYKRCTP